MQLNSVVGGYKVIDVVGEGGMGTVFRGLDILLEREVALKLLRPELTHNPHLVKRFRTEAVALARLNHPHIVTLHQLFRDGENYFMVLEYVLGETLDKLIKRCGPIPWQTALPLICQALEGLEHAHILKVIHRDIKPANLILTQNGVVKLMDFGVARMLENTDATQSGYILGTLKYMSPEQIQGQDIDYRVDIYAIGMVLYELLTGHATFDKHTDYELIRAHVEEYPKPPMMFVPQIPPRLDAAVLRALEKSAADRFQSASEFRHELEAILKAASADSMNVEEAFPDLRTQPSDLLADTFTNRTRGEAMQEASDGLGEEGESAAPTVLLPPRGINAEPPQEAEAAETPANSFWSTNARAAFAALLLPVFLLAIYLLPIGPRSPAEEGEAQPLAPEIQAAIEHPSSAGKASATIVSPAQAPEKVPEGTQHSESLGPIDNDGQASLPGADASQISPIEPGPAVPPTEPGVQLPAENPLVNEPPRAAVEPASETSASTAEKPPVNENAGAAEMMAGQAVNAEDSVVPGSKPSKSPASRRSSSRRNKLDGGWTIISD